MGVLFAPMPPGFAWRRRRMGASGVEVLRCPGSPGRISRGKPLDATTAQRRRQLVSRSFVTSRGVDEVPWPGMPGMRRKSCVRPEMFLRTGACEHGLASCHCLVASALGRGVLDRVLQSAVGAATTRGSPCLQVFPAPRGRSAAHFFHCGDSVAAESFCAPSPPSLAVALVQCYHPRA